MFNRTVNGISIISPYGTHADMLAREDKPDVSEAKFIRYLPKVDNDDDAHIITYVHHFSDGKMYKELKVIRNWLRPIWITKEINRKYKDKKEFEHISRLDKVKTRQVDMDKAICSKLDIIPSNYNLRVLKDSPYIYGYDIPSIALMAYEIKKRNNNHVSNYHVLNLDTEGDVTGKYNDMSICTLSMPGYRHTAALRRLYKGYNTDAEIEARIRELDAEYLPDSETKKNCKIYNITLHDTDTELIDTVISVCHGIMPDFVTIHNLKYDVGEFLRLRIKKEGDLDSATRKLADLFRDPSLPKSMSKFNYNPADGTGKSKRWEDQWSSVDISASFMIMDTMTTYSYIRQATGKVVGGYGLDNLLKKHKVAGKLLYEDEVTKTCSKKEYHAHMSENHPFEYTIYANQDTVGMTELERQTEDFTQSLAIFAGISDFNRFNSSVHKYICTAYNENVEDGWIIGTTPRTSNVITGLGTNNWIITLPSGHIQDIGLHITNVPGLTTNVTAHADDADCVSSYPSDIQALNVSMATLRAEILSVGDYSLDYFKAQNINIISSRANTIEYCANMMKLPRPIDMIEIVKKYNSINTQIAS